MAFPYDSGAPNPYFPKHRYHGIPLGRTAPTGETLSAELLWATFQAEAENLLTDDGRWISDDRERNKRINRAYASGWPTGASNGPAWQPSRPGKSAAASSTPPTSSMHAGANAKTSAVRWAMARRRASSTARR